MTQNLRRLMFLALAAAGLPACGNPIAAGDGASAIEGRVSLGPSMPVCRQGIPCDRAFSGAKVVVRTESGASIARATADEDGKFRVDVAAGVYNVGVDVDGPLPRCSQIRVVVTAGKPARADVDCDTGIR